MRLKEGDWIEWSDGYGSLTLRIDSFRDTEIVAFTRVGAEYRIDPRDISAGRIRVIPPWESAWWGLSVLSRPNVLRTIVYFALLQKANEEMFKYGLFPRREDSDELQADRDHQVVQDDRRRGS